MEKDYIIPQITEIEEVYSGPENKNGSFSVKPVSNISSGPSAYTYGHQIWAAVGVLVVLFIIWAVLGSFGFVPLGEFPLVSGSKWQAVFLTNGQGYFGHLQNYNRGYVTIQDVYYLQTSQALQPEQQTASNLNLVKLGGELHGPEDVIFIPKEQIIFWENMKADSQIVKGIESSRR